MGLGMERKGGGGEQKTPDTVVGHEPTTSRSKSPFFGAFNAQGKGVAR